MQNGEVTPFDIATFGRQKDLVIDDDRTAITEVGQWYPPANISAFFTITGLGERSFGRQGPANTTAIADGDGFGCQATDGTAEKEKWVRIVQVYSRNRRFCSLPYPSLPHSIRHEARQSQLVAAKPPLAVHAAGSCAPMA